MGLALSLGLGICDAKGGGSTPAITCGLRSAFPIFGTALNATEFDPTQLAGLALWLRADLGVTIVQGPVVATGTTPPAVTFTGTPSSSSNTIVLTCTAAGTQTTATFSWTLNGVAQTPFTAAATVVLPGTGITANFPVGAYTNTPSADTYTSVVTVSAWADQSGTGDANKNVVQATATKQPAFTVADSTLNNLPSLTFNRANQTILASGVWASPPSQTIEFAVAGQAPYDGANNLTWLDGDASNKLSMSTSSANYRLYIDAGSQLFSPNNSYSSGAIVFGAVFAGGSSAIYINNSQTPVASGAAGTASATKVCVGNSGTGSVAINGSIGEVVGISGGLTAAQRKQLYAYLGARYGLAVS